MSPSVDRLNKSIIIAAELGFCMMTWIINRRVGVPQTSALTDISDFGFDDSACLTSSNYCLSLGRHVTTEYEQKVKPATSHSYFVTSPPPPPPEIIWGFVSLLGLDFALKLFNFFLCETLVFVIIGSFEDLVHRPHHINLISELDFSEFSFLFLSF